jgi:hypothetical protein
MHSFIIKQGRRYLTLVWASKYTILSNNCACPIHLAEFAFGLQR